MNHATIRIYATLRRAADGKASLEVACKENDTVRDVLERADLPVEQVQVVFVNHKVASLDDPVQPGDQIGAFPAIGGG